MDRSPISLPSSRHKQNLRKPDAKIGRPRLHLYQVMNGEIKLHLYIKRVYIYYMYIYYMYITYIYIHGFWSVIPFQARQTKRGRLPLPRHHGAAFEGNHGLASAATLESIGIPLLDDSEPPYLKGSVIPRVMKRRSVPNASDQEGPPSFPKASWSSGRR